VLEDVHLKEIHIVKKQLSQKMFSLIIDIIQRRSPKLLNLPFFNGNESLTDIEREELREVLSDEFCEFGLKADSEPNDYGLLIEHSIDEIGHL
jgi:hypothetical protein